MNKKLYEKWYVWIVFIIISLIIIQIMFTIKAPTKWFEAKWTAGELLSFVGTIFLGYIAVRQTQQANKVAKLSYELSRELIKQQRAEYSPLVELTSFVGITKFKMDSILKQKDSKIVFHEIRTTDKEVILGYSVTLMVEKNTNIVQQNYVRSYEVNLKYSGKFPIKNISITEIVFQNLDFERKFKLSADPLMSLCKGNKIRFFIFLVSDNDFIKEQNQSYQYIKSGHIKFVLNIESFDNTSYEETINVAKHLIVRPEKNFNKPYIELPISVSYDLVEK